MEDKKSAKERFLDGFLGGVEDWNKHLAEAISKDENPSLNKNMSKILEEQEPSILKMITALINQAIVNFRLQCNWCVTKIKYCYQFNLCRL